jgi:nucleotide-binding universal stress UspA family protein
MFNKIMVPLDGSELAERALAPAKVLARESQAELLLVRVLGRPPVFVPAEAGYGVLYADQSYAEALEQTRQYLAGLRTALAADGLGVRAEVLEGDVASEVVDSARRAQASLMIMSSHGYSGVKRWLLGSVAAKVLPAAPCPVWVVRTVGAPRNLLLTLDGSPLAEQALAPALAVARCFGTAVTLLRVVPELGASEFRGLEKLEAGMAPRFVEEAREAAADYLALIADRCGNEGLELKTVVRSGPAADTILEYAEQNAVDLVAMTTHGRTGLRRWLYGSVTQKVLDRLPCSLLVAHPAPGEV